MWLRFDGLPTGDDQKTAFAHKLGICKLFSCLGVLRFEEGGENITCFESGTLLGTSFVLGPAEGFVSMRALYQRTEEEFV